MKPKPTQKQASQTKKGTKLRGRLLKELEPLNIPADQIAKMLLNMTPGSLKKR